MAVLICTTCDSEVDLDDEDFCPTCGTAMPDRGRAAPVPDPVAEPAADGGPATAPDHCPHCGADVPHPGNQACTSCYRSFVERPPAAPPTRAVPVGRPAGGPAAPPPDVDVAGTRRDAGGVSLAFVAGDVDLGRLDVRAGQDITVGREPDLPSAELLARWDNVSRRHARIGVNADGTCWVADENSTNGTLLNGRPVRPGGRETVRDGDRLRFGADVTATVTRAVGR